MRILNVCLLIISAGLILMAWTRMSPHHRAWIWGVIGLAALMVCWRLARPGRYGQQP